MNLRWAWSDFKYMFNAVAPLAFSRWTFFHSQRDTLPLTDSPILVLPASIMVAISPRLLLEIEPK